jgi:hypothetical protein
MTGQEVVQPESFRLANGLLKYISTINYMAMVSSIYKVILHSTFTLPIRHSDKGLAQPAALGQGSFPMPTMDQWQAKTTW